MANVELITSEWKSVFQHLLSPAREELLIVSPFVSAEPLEHLGRVLARKRDEPLHVSLLLNASPANLQAGSVDAQAMYKLVYQFPHVRTAHLGNLHAKTYVCDGKIALITSANFTTGGWVRNREIGVRAEDTVLVDQLRAYVLSLFQIATHLTVEDWEFLSQVQPAVRESASVSTPEAQRIQHRLQEARVRQSIRQGHVSENRIFANTILFLLRQYGPLTTAELHPLVQQLHPELCDDTVDRVIRGVHFGKRWKHMVRNAQQYLKRAGYITYDPTTRKWLLAATMDDRR